MKRALNIVLAAALFVFASGVVADEEGGTPEALIEEMRHDLGEVFEADAYEHAFVVKNIGSTDLKIEKVKPSCGCTVADFDKVIPPGGSGKIHLKIDGQKVSGNFSKNATVTTNDPKHPRMTISLAGQIVQHVTVEPSNRIYLRGMYGERIVKEITVSSVELKNDFAVTGLSSNLDDKMTYRYEPGAQPGEYRVFLFKNPKVPTMKTWGTLKIHTNSEKSPEKVVQVNVTTRGSIVVQPTTLNFGSVAPSGTSGVEKAITVFKVKGEFDIRDVEFSSNNYEASVEPIEEGRKYRVTVNFHPNGDAESYLDEMIIKTNDPLEPYLRVKLLARALGS